jgi:hypothetical protein
VVIFEECLKIQAQFILRIQQIDGWLSVFNIYYKIISLFNGLSFVLLGFYLIFFQYVNLFDPILL